MVYFLDGECLIVMIGFMFVGYLVGFFSLFCNCILSFWFSCFLLLYLIFIVVVLLEKSYFWGLFDDRIRECKFYYKENIV